MDFIPMILVGLMVGAALALILLSGRDAGGSDSRLLRSEIRLLSDRITSETSSLARRLEAVDDRMSRSQIANSELARGIFDGLGEVRTAARSVADHARQFDALENLLRVPSARGGLGEAMLEELLRQILPPSAYSTQHRFNSGVIVDAVVHAGGRLICIDSKFPLSNHRRMVEASSDSERANAERQFASDVARHLNDISTRYIVPDEKTFDFAVMYVPAEGVYADVLRIDHRKRPLLETALEARVVPMSPLTMYGYLQTVMFGLKCLRIEQNAEEILARCGGLERDLDRFVEDYETLGGHLSRARSRYEEGARRLGRFREKLEGMSDLAGDGDGTHAIPPGDEEDRARLEAVGD
jgi:DNA recombination protein RmuC